jgi:N-acetylmuramoyl-L-alanine amidase
MILPAADYPRPRLCALQADPFPPAAGHARLRLISCGWASRAWIARNARNILQYMVLRPFTELPSRFAWAAAHWWYGVRVYWYTANKTPWVFALIAGLAIALFGFAIQANFARQDDRRNLACLARNVYFEARGEPVAGQYAVAEVTMNRKASGRYSDTVCGVVYQKNWDPLRKRYVGAFSWTELEATPIPMGEEWQRAWKVAEAVYYRREAPVLEGALFYHANYIKPSWAREKQKLARIGKHVFYE